MNKKSIVSHLHSSDKLCIDLLKDMGIDVDRTKYNRWHFAWCERRDFLSFKVKLIDVVRICYN